MSVLIGVAFIIVFYVTKNSVFSGKGSAIFKGYVNLVASFLIAVLGFAMLRFMNYERKWERKLRAAHKESVEVIHLPASCLVTAHHPQGRQGVSGLRAHCLLPAEAEEDREGDQLGHLPALLFSCLQGGHRGCSVPGRRLHHRKHHRNPHCSCGGGHLRLGRGLCPLLHVSPAHNPCLPAIHVCHPTAGYNCRLTDLLLFCSGRQIKDMWWFFVISFILLFLIASGELLLLLLLTTPRLNLPNRGHSQHPILSAGLASTGISSWQKINWFGTFYPASMRPWWNQPVWDTCTCCNDSINVNKFFGLVNAIFGYQVRMQA